MKQFIRVSHGCTAAIYFFYDANVYIIFVYTKKGLFFFIIFVYTNIKY